MIRAGRKGMERREGYDRMAPKFDGPVMDQTGYAAKRPSRGYLLSL